MSRNVSPLAVAIALAALAAALGVAYHFYARSQVTLYPGMADMPPHTAADDKPVAPPPEAGPVPGTMRR